MPLISGEMADPFTFLGAHPVVLDTGPALAVRALLPGARSVAVLDLDPGQEIPAPLVDEHGLFEAVLPSGESGRGNCLSPGRSHHTPST